MSLLLGLALADAIDPAPYDCPRGSVGQSNHNGAWCQPTICTDDSDCSSGKVCSEDVIAFCTETRTMDCGGLSHWDDDCTETRTMVHHPCGANDGCALGRCETVRRCAASRTPPKRITAKKGCQTSALGGLLLALAGLFGRRRD